MARSVAHARSNARPDIVAVVGLDHHVVQLLRQVERRVRQRHRVMAGVAVVETHLELHPLGDVHLQPVRLREPETVNQEGVRLVEGRRGEHDMAEPDAFGQEPARHQRRREHRRRQFDPFDHLDPHAPRRRGVHQPPDPPRHDLGVRALDDLMAGGAQSGGDPVEGVPVDRLEADEEGIVGWARAGR